MKLKKNSFKSVERNDTYEGYSSRLKGLENRMPCTAQVPVPEARYSLLPVQRIENKGL